LSTPITTRRPVESLTLPYAEMEVADAAPHLSVRTAIETCIRRKRLLLAVFLLCMAATVAAIYLLPPRYQATMSILVQNARETPLVSSEPDKVVQITPSVTEEQVNSEMELLHSRDLLTQVIDKMQGSSMQGSGRMNPEQKEKALRALSRALVVSVVRNSNVLTVSYTDSSPDKAQGVLHLVADAYLAKHLTLSHPSGTFGFFKAQADQAHKLLTDAQEQLSGLKAREGLTSLDDEKAALFKQINLDDADLTQLQGMIQENAGLAGAAHAEMSSISPRIPTQVRTVPNQYSVEQLNTMLAQLTNQRIGLLAKFNPGDRLVKEVDDEIANVRKNLAAVEGTAEQEKTTDVNPVSQELEQTWAKSRVSLKGLEAHESVLAAEKTQLQNQLSALEKQTADYDALQSQVTEDQRNYDLYAEKRDQAQVDEAMDRERFLNVAIADPPSASMVAIQPRPKLYLALGLMTAFLLSISSSLLAEMSRDTFYTPAELEKALGLPTLATVPRKGIRSPASRSQASLSARASFADAWVREQRDRRS
jgi:uncharacterized protein involved in exopolysaccharide biosynthesis